MTSFFYYPTPYGSVTIAQTGDGISRVYLGELELEGTYEPTALTNEASTQILQYLAGQRQQFDLPLVLSGTDFELEVWEALQNIPYGQTRTARELAGLIGKPNAYRRIGAALKANPMDILIPTQRISDSQGRILGTDRTHKIRRALLKLEKRYADGSMP